MSRKENKQDKIKVLIADDHALFREMLYHTFEDEEDIEIVGEAVNGEEAVKKTRELSPDIILLDIEMPVLNGIQATEQIKNEFPDAKVVILTAYDEDQVVFQLIQAGATGYLLKDGKSEDVVKAIRSAYSGESLIQPRIANKILKEYVRLITVDDARKKKELPSIITEREKDVLRLIAQGKNNKEIASILFISEATVKTHVANIFRKLGLRDRVEVVLFAVQHGLIV